MTTATLSALLLLAAGALHSYSFMCRKLPASRRPRFYPEKRAVRLAFDLAWVGVFFAGIRLAFVLSPALGITAAVIYFVGLPFVYQPMIARMLGFNGLRAYIEYLQRHDR